MLPPHPDMGTFFILNRDLLGPPVRNIVGFVQKISDLLVRGIRFTGLPNNQKPLGKGLSRSLYYGIFVHSMITVSKKGLNIKITVTPAAIRTVGTGSRSE